MALRSPKVHGLNLDSQTRCSHYNGETDIIAIKIKCCGVYYACKDCHEALAGHDLEAWPRMEWNRKAVLCGVCKKELTINHYLSSGDQCPYCKARFNPGCRNHHPFYFEMKQHS